MIQVLSNSHAHYFANSDALAEAFCHKQHPYFRAYSIGPVIAYNFYEHHLQTVKDLLVNTIKPKLKDYIIINFGEVDCRLHLPKRASQTGQYIVTVVNECVDRYFRAILDLKESGYNMIVFGAHPSTTGPHNDDPSNPVFGDCLYRNSITKQYNTRLSERCSENDIPYLDMFDELVDENGYTKMNPFYRDYCHLSQASHGMMVEKLKNMGFINE